MQNHLPIPLVSECLMKGENNMNINVQDLGSIERVEVTHSRADRTLQKLRRLEKNSIDSYNKLVERTNKLVEKFDIDLSKTEPHTEDYDYQKVKDDELSLDERDQYYGPNGE